MQRTKQSSLLVIARSPCDEAIQPAPRADSGFKQRGRDRRHRHCERQRGNPWCRDKEELDCFVARAPRNDGVSGAVQIRIRILAALTRPRYASIDRPCRQRARRMPGAPSTRGRVRKWGRRLPVSRLADLFAAASLFGRRGERPIRCVPDRGPFANSILVDLDANNDKPSRGLEPVSVAQQRAR